MKSLLKQFARPSGWWGWVAGWIMARANRRLNAWSVELLEIRPGDRILEVGFGPGLAIRMIAEKNPDVLVDGIDFSVVMVRQAGRRNAWAVRQGQVALRYGSVTELPYRKAIFDKAFAVNNIREWPDAITGLKELWRVIKPGGLVAVTVQPHGTETEEGFAKLVEGIRKEIAQVGFDEVGLERKQKKPAGAVCVLGRKKAEGQR